MRFLIYFFFVLSFTGACCANQIAVSPPLLYFEDSTEQEFLIINSNDFEVRYAVESLDKEWFTFRGNEGIVDANGKETVTVLLRNLDQIPKSKTNANIILRTFQNEENGFVINPGIIIKAVVRKGTMDFNAVVDNQKPKFKETDDMIVKKVRPKVNYWILGGMLLLIVMVVVGLVLVDRYKII